MAKNIVVCCDGTANEFARDQTNVVKLYSMLEQNPLRQLTYYHPGLGTMEPAGALTKLSRRITKLLGQAIGYGLEADIRDAYVFLMNSYLEGDRIFLFGFSRGAYTVRALASLIRMYGIIRTGNEPLVPYAIRMLTGINAARAKRPQEARTTNAETSALFKLANEFKSTFSSSNVSNIRFVGVWDTVNSVGWIENPLKLPYTANNPSIEVGRHAISIDERRAFFRTNLWKLSTPPADSGPKNLKQVWFAGVHCDVGGGYPESQSGLSKNALKWMVQEARASGLFVDLSKMTEILGRGPGDWTPPNAKADRHESLKGAWRIAEFFPKKHFNRDTGKEERRMNLFRRRTIPNNSLIHESVFQRGDEYLKLLPPGAVCEKTLPEPPPMY
jgi:uncharacterized protein (DUF2235 family)